MTSSSSERYEVVRRLGEGGMGSVWLAWDTLLQRNVAIKRMRLGSQNPAVSNARVLREARALSRLSHPNIVRVIELVEGDDGPLIVMDYVEGHSLDDWIKKRPAKLTERRVAEIGLTVLDALKVAHDRGVLHRDVKPANILIKDTAGSLRSRICLVDFGNAAMEGHELTTRGNVVGTLAYVAPERFDRTTIGPASDLWSLGVTLYEAVERRLPFQRENTLQIYRAIHDDAPDPLEHARQLAGVLTRLLEKDPEQRPNPDETGAMLRQVIEAGKAERTSQGGDERTTEDTDTDLDDTGRQDTTTLPPSMGFAEIAALSPKQAVAVLRKLGPRRAAPILGRVAAKNPNGANAVIKEMDDPFAVELLRHTKPAAVITLLLGLTAEHGARLVGQVPKSSAAAIISALSAREPRTVRLMEALSPKSAARLLDSAAAEQVIALTEPYGRQRITAVLAVMSPGRVAEILDRMSVNLGRAAMVLRGLPRDRVGPALDLMDAARAAVILQADPARASGFLRLMRPECALRVIEHMDQVL